jgi:hypothetical protein
MIGLKRPAAHWEYTPTEAVEGRESKVEKGDASNMCATACTEFGGKNLTPAAYYLTTNTLSFQQHYRFMLVSPLFSLTFPLFASVFKSGPLFS